MFLVKLYFQNNEKVQKWRDGWIDENKARSLHWMSLYNIVFDKF